MDLVHPKKSGCVTWDDKLEYRSKTGKYVPRSVAFRWEICPCCLYKAKARAYDFVVIQVDGSSPWMQTNGIVVPLKHSRGGTLQVSNCILNINIKLESSICSTDDCNWDAYIDELL